MIRVIVLLGIAVLLYFLFRWLSRQPRRVFWQWIGALVAVGLLVLVATGRAHWLAAVFAALIPFIRAILAVLGNLPLLRRVLAGVNAAKGSAGSGSGHTSNVSSRYIRMTLDHDTGDIDGEVLEGRFRGSPLGQMPLDDLLQLLDEIRHDEESVALLQAYLDRIHGDAWRDRTNGQEQQQSPGAPGVMSREEALQVLGLPSEASEADIIQAHRRLMQNLHPDRGGSAYLAAKINRAKETLLGS